MRTADRARADGIRDVSRGHEFVPLLDHIAEELPATTIVVADNVAEFARNQQSGSLEDFPSVAPPWPRTWIEYPSTSGNERRAVLVHDMTGTFNEAEDPPAGPFTDMLKGAAADAEAKEGSDVEIGWMLGLIVFVEAKNKVIGPAGMFTLALDPSGRVVGNRWMLTAKMAVESPELWLLAAIDPALWTLALCHVRNASWERVTPPVHRRHRRRGAHSPMRYHVLKLALPRRASAGVGGVAGSWHSPGLHVVAGHFAHYGNCCPTRHPPRGRLFGRLEGVYWVPVHLRGAVEEGVVRTDFEPRVQPDG
jgi:hypothetical protein